MRGSISIDASGTTQNITLAPSASGTAQVAWPNGTREIAGVPLASDTIQYVSANGNDANDGLSWGTAKATVAAACAALPSGNATCSAGYGVVYVSPAFTGTAVIPPSGPGYSTVPTVVYLPAQSQTIILGSAEFPFNNAGMQSAVTALCAAGGGGEIDIPPGWLNLFKPIQPTCAITIKGDGPNSTTIYNDISPAAAAFLFTEQIPGIVIEDLTINGWGTTGIDFVAPASGGIPGYGIIRDILFEGSSLVTSGQDVGIQFDNTTGVGACVNEMFESLTFDSDMVAVKAIGPAGGTAGEGNQWSDIRLQGGAGLTVSPLQLEDNSEVWSNLRLGTPLAAGVPMLSTSGALNTFNVTCDGGTICIYDTGGANKFIVNLVSGSVGTIASSSMIMLSSGFNPNLRTSLSAETISSGVNRVTFSSTPIFDASLGNTQEIALSGSVTSSTLSNAVTGEYLYFVVCENSMGGYTFAWPSNFVNATAIATSSSVCTAESFIYDGTNAYHLQ